MTALPCPADPLASARIALDCRWLSYGGAGRVTETLLAALRETPPPGEWILWGDPKRIGPRTMPGALITPATGKPTQMFGQRSLIRIPRADVVVYMHQMRPLRPGRSVTVIHDTIPLRYGGRWASRQLKRGFLHLATRLSARIITDSEFSRACIARDLRVPRGRITTAGIPIDGARSERILRLRDALPQERTLLFVGRFGQHKNLRRLCDAFSSSRFRARGGQLMLAGGSPDEVAALSRWIAGQGSGGVDVRGHCTEAELERLMATSRALILPSMEEGYGLPAFEAAAAGLPVAASRTGAMADLPPDAACLLDPADVADITRAIDEVTERPHTGGWRIPEVDFAGQYLDAIREALGGPSAQPASPR